MLAFLFPANVAVDGMPQQGRRYPFVLWLVASLGFSALGWITGGFLGSWTPRMACAVAATALALGLLTGQRGAALVGAASAALVTLVAFRVGLSFYTPLIAWPVAGLVIGVMGAFLFRRRRARIAYIVAAPFLAFLGFLAGTLATLLVAWGVNDPRVSAQFMLGGAAGFGFLLIAGAAIAEHWLDSTKKAGRVS
jgi:hypothetical protein